MSIVLNSLKISVVKPKKKSNSIKKISKLIRGLVIEDEDGNFKCSIDIKQDDNSYKELIIPFTPKSFEVIDRLSVFTKQKDENGKRIRIVRDASRAKFFPGTQDQYIPFDNNWVIEGYLVQDGLLQMFDFKDLITIDGYDVIQSYV